MVPVLAARRPLQPVVPLLCLGTAVGVVELVGGFMLPAMALNLEARGASLAVIGSQAAMVGLGLMLSALLVPWLGGLLGPVGLGLVNLALTSLAARHARRCSCCAPSARRSVPCCCRRSI